MAGGARVRILQDVPFAMAMQGLVDDAGEVTFAPDGDFVKAEGEFDAILVHQHPHVGSKVLERFPTVRVVANFGVGVDHINVAACTARKVIVTNTPGAMVDTTADLALALLLAAARNVVPGSRST